MQPHLEPLLKSEETYWLSNLNPWIAGMESELLVSVVSVSAVTIDRRRAFVVDLSQWVPATHLASSIKRLKSKIEYWESMRPAEEPTLYRNSVEQAALTPSIAV